MLTTAFSQRRVDSRHMAVQLCVTPTEKRLLEDAADIDDQYVSEWLRDTIRERLLVDGRLR